MQSRMEKYFDSKDDNEPLAPRSRIKKNQELYKEVSKLELEGFDLNSNVSVLGDNTSNINLDDIKDILDKKYHEAQKNKSFGDISESTTVLSLNETREYDINSLLEKAKEKKEVNYEEERLKKIRNTQYDILKSLDIMNNEEEPEETPTIVENSQDSKENSEQKLRELIDTITAKELIKEEEALSIEGEMDPLDLFSDLKGDDENTRVMGMLVEELKEAEKENTLALEDMRKRKLENTLEKEQSSENESDEEETEEEIHKTMSIKEFDKEIEEEMRRREEEKNKQHSKKEHENKIHNTLTNTLTNTFTNTMSFTQSDFDDFIDLKEDMQVTKIIVKILIVIIIIAFIIGIIILVNNFLQLGLF